MVAVKDVLCRIAHGAQGGVRIAVSATVAEKDVNPKGVEKVLRVARISARRMGEGRDARGATMFVICLRGAKPECVHLMEPWCRITGSMVEPASEPAHLEKWKSLAPQRT